MSNDLLFSVIPRTGKVPVKSSTGVTRVDKDARSDRINEKNREQQEEKNHADQEAMQKRHGKAVNNTDSTSNKNDDDDNDGPHLDTYA